MLQKRKGPGSRGEAGVHRAGAQADHSGSVTKIHGNRPFRTQREAALALLNGSSRITRKAGSFLGQCVADPMPLTPSQREWLDTLLERAELPPLAMEAAHG